MEGLGYRSNQQEPSPFLVSGQDEDSPDNTSVSLSSLPGYEFGEKIGEGGMATVYRGRQLSLDRPVAIKMLNQQMAKHSQVYEAFEREAVIIARLNHPNIIHVIDRGICGSDQGEQGRPYFIMEYIDGIDLACLIREGQLPLQKRIEICLQICKALSYAHKNGVIHRDVKPGNVIVDNDLNVKVLDFGIALFFDNASFDLTQASSGGESVNTDSSLGMQDGFERDVMGTFNYMAPELNASASKATALSDIYSLGVIMYELFAGQLPSQAQRLKAAKDSPLPKSVADLVMRCLSPEPDKRPRSMIELHDQLLVLLRGAHLNKQGVHRANASINNKKTFSLLDIIREQQDSAVYLFIEKHSGQQFVIKKTTGSYQGFETAQQLGKLSHRNIVRVHGASKNERAFIEVLDYVRGGSLQERLVQTYSLENFLVVARQICRGLAFAHKHHIIHGNLRPSNVLFDENDVVKLSDFGLPHHANPNLASKAHEQESAFQIKDEPLCPQSDLYACGVIFHFMLLGVLPRYHNGSLQEGRAFKRLPGDLKTVLHGLLTRHVPERYKNALQVLEDFERLSDTMPTQVWEKNISTVPAAVPVTKTKTILLLALLIILFLLVANANLFNFLGDGSVLSNIFALDKNQLPLHSP